MNVNGFNKVIDSQEHTLSNDSGPGLHDHLEYPKTDSNLKEKCFLEFLEKHGIDVKDDDQLDKFGALFKDESKDPSNKEDCENLLKFAHMKDDNDKSNEDHLR